MTPIRKQLVDIALKWEKEFSNIPAITSAISEYDAAICLLGMTETEYKASVQGSTAVQKGHDFVVNRIEFPNGKIQVKGNRPSGKQGSKVTKVAKANNYDWDFLVWILYDKDFKIAEAWCWPCEKYRKKFEERTRLSPDDLRQEGGTRLYPPQC